MFIKQKIFALTIIAFLALFFIFAQSVQASNAFIFNKNLQSSNTNTDVKELQKFLNNNGYILSKSGVGSLGRETNFFGSVTKIALIKFQKANKISPAIGYFGPTTRKVVNSIGGSLTSNSSQTNSQTSNNQLVSLTSKTDYYIGGSITGVVGPVLLQNNGKDDLIIDVGQNSNFTFKTAVANGAGYNVTAQSKSLGQTCYVYNNVGVVSGANIDSVKIGCGAKLLYNPFTYVPSGGISSYSLNYTAGVGGTISGATSQTINSGSNGSAVTAIPNTGYSFVSWSDGILTAERLDSSITANKSVSAVFEINTYNITYDANGSTGGTKPVDQIKTHDSTLVLATNGSSLIKTGYTFIGWNTLADGTGIDYAVGADYIANTSTTLFSNWAINSYTITFNTNGGDGGSTATQTLEFASTTSLRANGFTKTGYTFAGWATTTDGVVDYANGASYSMGAGNVTLYAKWNPAVVVGASYQGGKVAYIFEVGDPGYVAGETHGLIISTTTQSTGVIWAKPANQNSAVPGGTSNALGSGSTNTNNIVAQNGLDNTYAAGKARSFTGGGYNDWYLPSLDDLTEIYANRVIIGDFTADYYWSSSEGGVTTAWSKHFTGASISNQLKSTQWTYVRAVRSF